MFLWQLIANLGRPAVRNFGELCVSAVSSYEAHEMQGRKKNTNPNLLVWMSSSGVGVFHVKGWGPKSWVYPSKPRENKPFLAGCPGISRGCPKSLRKKGLCSFLFPKKYSENPGFVTFVNEATTSDGRCRSGARQSPQSCALVRLSCGWLLKALQGTLNLVCSGYNLAQKSGWRTGDICNAQNVRI